ncbi:hypothetical protein L0F63_006943 [Massospora cicadina]|nr:hypothetical protein L0F63_006943 [Massospora cicadina]
MTLPDEFFPTDLLQDGRLFESRRKPSEEAVKGFEATILEGVKMIRRVTPSAERVSEVTFRERKVKLCPGENKLVPQLAKTLHLERDLTHVLFKRFIASRDEPSWMEALLGTGSAAARKALVEEMAKTFLHHVIKSRLALLQLLTCIALAKADPAHPLHPSSRLLFAKFCVPALCQVLLANLKTFSSRDIQEAQFTLSLLIGLCQAKVPTPPETKLSFAEWYFSRPHDDPATSDLIGALFVSLLEMESLEYLCDPAPDTPHWTVESADLTCSILEAGLRSPTSPGKRLAFKALSLLSKSLLELFSDLPPTQGATKRLHAFLLNPISLLPDHLISDLTPRESLYSVPLVFDRRLTRYTWMDVLKTIQNLTFGHVVRVFAPVLVASAVLESGVVDCLDPFLACAAKVYRNDARLCEQVWGSKPGSSQRAILRVAQWSYPANPKHLPSLLRALSAGCCSHVVKYLGHLPSFAHLNAKAILHSLPQSARATAPQDGTRVVVCVSDFSVRLPLTEGQFLSMLIPLGTRGETVSSTCDMMTWAFEYSGWDLFLQIFEAIAEAPQLDAHAVALLQPIVELLAELAGIQPGLLKEVLCSDLKFVRNLVALAHVEAPEANNLISSLLLFMAALLPIYPRLIANALLVQFSSPAFPNLGRNDIQAMNLLRMFNHCATFCCRQLMLDVTGGLDLAELGARVLRFALTNLCASGKSDVALLLKPNATSSKRAYLIDLQILSRFIRLGQRPGAPSWVGDVVAEELSEADRVYGVAHTFLSAVGNGGPRLLGSVELLGDFLLLGLALRQHPRFDAFRLVRALLEHSNPHSPWIVVSLFEMLGSDLRLAFAAAKALGLLLATAGGAGISCLAGHLPGRHAAYGACLARLLRVASTPLNLKCRVWYLLAVLATFQLELLSLLFPDAAVLADVILQHLSAWGASDTDAPVACFLAAIWKGRWRTRALTPLLAPKVWELVGRQIRHPSQNPGGLAASVHLLELVGHALPQQSGDGWEASFFDVVRGLADPRLVASVFLRGLSLSPKPQALDQLAECINAPVCALPQQGTLVGALCSNGSGLIYDLSAVASDVPAQLEGLRAADRALFGEQAHGRYLVAWQRTLTLLFTQPEDLWSGRGGSCSASIAELIEGLIGAVGSVFSHQQPISSVGALALGNLLADLLACAATHHSPNLVDFLSCHHPTLVRCARWSDRQRVTCRGQHALALAQAEAWYRVLGRGVQLLAQGNVSQDLGMLLGGLELELYRLLEGDFSQDRGATHEALLVLLEALIILLGMPEPSTRKGGAKAAACLSTFLLGGNLAPLLTHQLILVLLRWASVSPEFLDALPQAKLAQDFPHLSPLPTLEASPGDDLPLFTHAAFLRLVGLFKPARALPPAYLTRLTEFVRSATTAAEISPAQLCLLRSSTQLLVSPEHSAPQHNAVAELLPELLGRLLDGTFIGKLPPASHQMQLAKEQEIGGGDPVDLWTEGLIACALNDIAQRDYDERVYLNLTLDVTPCLSFGSLVEVIKRYSHSTRQTALRLVTTSLDLLHSQLLLLANRGRLTPLYRRHLAYDIRQELDRHRPSPQLPADLARSWHRLIDLLSHSDFIKPY